MAYKFNREQVLDMQKPNHKLTKEEAKSLASSYIKDYQSSNTRMSRE